MKNIIPYLVIAGLVCLILRQCRPEGPATVKMIDSVVIRDTIRDTLLVPRVVYIARVDTVFLPVTAGAGTGERTGKADLSVNEYVPREVTDTLMQLLNEKPGNGAYALMSPEEIITTVNPDSIPALILIERKEYRTDDYHAVIEGFRPSLVRMEVFPETKYITETVTRTVTRKTRFGIGIQAGYGCSRQKAGPYFGIGLQYNIFTW